MSKFKNNKNPQAKYKLNNDYKLIDNGSNPKEEKENNNRNYKVQNDQSITGDLHEKMHLIKNFQTSLKNAGNIGLNEKSKKNWQKLFKKIPLTDELLTLSDDKRRSDIYNDLLKYFYHHYETFDTYERKNFFQQFPEIFDHLREKVKDNLEANKKFAKFSLYGVRSKEDMEYLYKVGHKSISGDSDGYFSESDPFLNTKIINSFLNIGNKTTKFNNTASGYSNVDNIDDDESNNNNNNFVSGVIKRTWRNYRKGNFDEKSTFYDKASEKPVIGKEPHQHFLFQSKGNVNKEEQKEIDFLGGFGNKMDIDTQVLLNFIF